MKKTTKSHLTKIQILSKFQSNICNIHTIKNSTNDLWSTKEFFMGEQKDSSSFWFSKHSVTNKSSSIDLPLSTSSVKIVVQLEEGKEETVVKYFFERTIVGYFLGSLSVLCLAIFLRVFYRFLFSLNLIYGIVSFFLLVLSGICGVGFFDPHDKALLLKQLSEIIQSDDLS